MLGFPASFAGGRLRLAGDYRVYDPALLRRRVRYDAGAWGAAGVVGPTLTAQARQATGHYQGALRIMAVKISAGESDLQSARRRLASRSAVRDVTVSSLAHVFDSVSSAAAFQSSSKDIFFKHMSEALL
jgi:hypothetical protein